MWREGSLGEEASCPLLLREERDELEAECKRETSRRLSFFLFKEAVEGENDDVEEEVEENKCALGGEKGDGISLDIGRTKVEMC